MSFRIPVVSSLCAFVIGCTLSSIAQEPTWEWQSNWPKVFEGKKLGPTHGCVVVDSERCVYLSTDTEAAVRVFSSDGFELRTFGAEWKSGLHGLEIAEHQGEEYLYVAHTARHEVAKMSLDGEVLWTVGWPQQSGLYGGPKEYKPTAIAVAEDGRFWVADGYGRGFIHAYDSMRNYIRSFGGLGTEPGKFRTPHGVTWDAQLDALVVADRENDRLQLFTPEGEFIGVVPTELSRPCHIDVSKEGWVVAELNGRVSVLERDGSVLARLGEQADPSMRANYFAAPSTWKEGEFIAPHCVAWVPNGGIYVAGWNATGRLTRLVRVD
ncbi:MAG: hypothetical protein MK213_03710 [Planctomycetes bacterium]|nr:hypothetical protein [Planctomycetota bacterium]